MPKTTWSFSLFVGKVVVVTQRNPGDQLRLAFGASDLRSEFPKQTTSQLSKTTSHIPPPPRPLLFASLAFSSLQPAFSHPTTL